MQKLELDAKTTALVLIDLQNGITAMTTAPYTTEQVVSQCAEMAHSLRNQGGTVVYVRVDMANFKQVKSDTPPRNAGVTPPPAASELVPAAGAQPGDMRITKHHWSALLGTDLEAQLHKKGIKTVVMGGLATNYGVESTARDACGMGFDVVIAEDAMSSISIELHKFAIENVFPRIARVRKSNEIKFV